MRIQFFLTGALMVAAASRAEEQKIAPLFGEIRRGAQEQFEDLTKLYTSIHTHPELSFQEKETSKRLAEELRKAGYEVTTGVGGTGVVGVMKNGDGPTVLVRADMDALPVAEETGAPYASRVTTKDDAGQEVPVMHACGHDIHVTSWVGAARLLAAMKDKWRGTLVMIGQPAEERGAGAKAMLEDGLYSRFPRPDFAVALHVDPALQAGKIAWISGYALANAGSVDVLIRGIGGHGAYPHLTKDPIVVAAQTVLALQTIVSRETPPTSPAVVTVGSIHGGTKHNIVPNEVKLQLTVRTYDDGVWDKVIASIDRIAKATALAAGIPRELEPIVEVSNEYTPSLFNTPELTARTVEVFRGLLGEGNVIEGEPQMGGEDFSRYGREEPRIPIFMYRLGSISPERLAASRAPGGEPMPSLHSSRYLPTLDPTIQTGVQTLTAAALNLLN